MGRGEILQRPLSDDERESARGLTGCQRGKAVVQAGARPVLVWWLIASVHGEKRPQRRPATVAVHCPSEKPTTCEADLNYCASRVPRAECVASRCFVTIPKAGDWVKDRFDQRRPLRLVVLVGVECAAKCRWFRPVGNRYPPNRSKGS